MVRRSERGRAGGSDRVKARRAAVTRRNPLAKKKGAGWGSPQEEGGGMMSYTRSLCARHSDQ
jgi:hypothetical protein